MPAKSPTVSVIMAVYNDARFIGQAIESVLGQTFPDFELIIVDDASTDGSREVVARYKDPRIRLLVNERNRGQALARNVALAHATGEYVAVHDSDDVSSPRRLEVQAHYLDAHPDVVMIGSSGVVIDESGARKGLWPVALDDVDIKWGMLFASAFIHSSVMMRRGALAKAGPYSNHPDSSYIEDYELATRVAQTGRVANLTEPLVSWRERSGSFSSRNRERLLQQLDVLSRRSLERLVKPTQLADLGALRKLLLLSGGQPADLTSSEARGGLELAERIRAQFYESNPFSRDTIREHARRTSWLWGKHILALACRNNGTRDLRCRLTLLSAGMRLLGNAGRLSLS